MAVGVLWIMSPSIGTTPVLPHTFWCFPGTVVLVPREYDGAICTSGFLAIRPESEEQAMLLWYVLRSEYCRCQIYYLAQTASQPELKAAVWRDQFVIPLPLRDLKDKAVSEVREFMDHVESLSNAVNVKLGGYG